MKKFLICSPTYNESENIETFCKKIFNINNNFHLLIIDDNSPDDTSGFVKRLKLKYKNLFLIKRKGKMGIGSALRTGFNFALKNNIIYIDPTYKLVNYVNNLPKNFTLKSLPYLEEDGHMNRIGYEIISEAIIAKLN